MTYIARASVLIIALLYLIPTAIVEMLGYRVAINSIFFICCFLLFFLSLIQVGHQNYLAAFEKFLAVSGFFIAIIVGFLSGIDGSFYLEGYKFGLVFLFLFFGREISDLVPFHKILKDLGFLFAAYLLVLALFYYSFDANELIREVGSGGLYSRLDMTGSVTVLAVSSCLSVFFVTALAVNNGNLIFKLFFVFVSIFALYIIALSASRQPVLIFAAFFIICIYFNWLHARHVFLKKLFDIALYFILLCIFIFAGWLINPSFYARIFDDESGDYTSGRLNSISMWVQEMNANGGPLGFGYIRNNTIQEIELLWPHNEFFRFYIEGGWLGGALIFLLVFYLVYVLRLALKSRVVSFASNLVFFVSSVVIVQILLENFFNNSFLSCLCFILLSLAAHNIYKSSMVNRAANAAKFL